MVKMRGSTARVCLINFIGLQLTCIWQSYKLYWSLVLGHQVVLFCMCFHVEGVNITVCCHEFTGSYILYCRRQCRRMCSVTAMQNILTFNQSTLHLAIELAAWLPIITFHMCYWLQSICIHLARDDRCYCCYTACNTEVILSPWCCGMLHTVCGCSHQF